jgi:uncharacterized membrane protein YcgQ (UPF0703/DUF1980 family)
MSMFLIITTGLFLSYVLRDKVIDLHKGPDFSQFIMWIPALAYMGFWILVWVKFVLVIFVHPYLIIRNQFYPHPEEYKFSYTWLVIYMFEVFMMVPLVAMYVKNMEMDSSFAEMKGSMGMKAAKEEDV